MSRQNRRRVKARRRPGVSPEGPDIRRQQFRCIGAAIVQLAADAERTDRSALRAAADDADLQVAECLRAGLPSMAEAWRFLGGVAAELAQEPRPADMAEAIALHLSYETITLGMVEYAVPLACGVANARGGDVLTLAVRWAREAVEESQANPDRGLRPVMDAANGLTTTDEDGMEKALRQWRRHADQLSRHKDPEAHVWDALADRTERLLAGCDMDDAQIERETMWAGLHILACGRAVSFLRALEAFLAAMAPDEPTAVA